MARLQCTKAAKISSATEAAAEAPGGCRFRGQHPNRVGRPQRRGQKGGAGRRRADTQVQVLSKAGRSKRLKSGQGKAGGLGPQAGTLRRACSLLPCVRSGGTPSEVGAPGKPR